MEAVQLILAWVVAFGLIGLSTALFIIAQR